MAISVGDKVPEVTLMQMGENGPEAVALADKLAGRKVALFGLPGAFTGTCSTAHVPSFMRTHDAFIGKGIDEVICVTVNDPFVVQAWSDQTGAGAAGITMLCDPESAYAKGTGLNFSAPPVGFVDRLMRHSMLIDDGTVTVLNIEDGPGTCEITAGEVLLEKV